MNSLQFTTHAEGLGFPEGPVYMPDGSIAFVDLLHGVIRSWNEKWVERLGESGRFAERHVPWARRQALDSE